MTRKGLLVLVCVSLCICAVLFISGCKKKNESFEILFSVDKENYLSIKTDGESIKEMPENPKKTGYEFDGWFYDDSFEKPFNKDTLAENPIKEDMTVYAGFSAIEYTATFKNGTDIVDTRTFTVEDTVIGSLPTVPAKEGYEGIWSNYTITASNMDISAVYNPVDYTINYTNVEGATNTNPISYNIETPTITLTDPIKAGYTFDGWFVGEDEVIEIVLGSYGDKSLEARWAPVEYEISYELNGGTNNASNPDSYSIETPTITLKDPIKAEYTFNGWFVGEDEVTKIVLGSYGDKSLEARWAPVEYEISYELNGGTNNASNLETYNVEDGTINLKNPTRSGKTFNGWKLEEEFVVSFSSSLAMDITLVATWIDEVVLTYTKESDSNIIIDGFENEEVRSTLRIFEIGETYNGYNVVGIDETFFAHFSALESITIPNSVKSIGGWAFDYCYNLDRVNYLGTIEEWCRIVFDGNTANPLSNGASLYINYELVKNLVIPDGVKSIDSYAFCGCTSLETITIPNSLESIGDDVFLGCTSLTYNKEANINYLGNATNPYLIAISVIDKTLSEYTLQNTTRLIYNNCFCDCSNLENITIPDGVKSIGENTFGACTSLDAISIPNSLESIGDYVFPGCTSLTYNKVANINYLGNATNPYLIAISVIDKTLSEYTLQNTTRFIYNKCFYDCSNLENITIPDGVKSIGENTFGACTSLDAITIPSSVKYIKANAFYDCNNLTKVKYLGTIEEWCEIKYDYFSLSNKSNPLSNGASLYINDEVVKNLVIPDSVTAISDFVFHCYVSLESITIPNSVESIGKWAFACCCNLKRVYIESEKVAEKIVLSDSMGSIVETATTIYIEESITTIGSYIDNYTKGSTATVGAVTYNIYTKK